MNNIRPTNNSKRGLRARGFTLVEMLLVLVILGLLAAIVYPKIGGLGDRARDQAAKAQISAFGTALDIFELENGLYPKGSRGLQALVQKPAYAANWRQYLKEIPADPWKNDYLYDSPGSHNVETYDISSMGRDSRAGTDDDITNWSNR
jgi:general secretion pathway protein G